MTDYIDREALIERLTRNLNACNPGTFSERCYQDAINTATFSPAADVAIVRHGWWVQSDHETLFACSICGDVIDVIKQATAQTAVQRWMDKRNPTSE